MFNSDYFHKRALMFKDLITNNNLTIKVFEVSSYTLLIYINHNLVIILLYNILYYNFSLTFLTRSFNDIFYRVTIILTGCK